MLAALLTAGCGSSLQTLNALTPDHGYVRTAGVPYGAGERETLDVYRSASRDPESPTVVFVYGGAWRDGKREDYEFVAGDLARAGFDVVVPDYRLFPDVMWPVFVEDVARAVAHVQADADTLLDRPLGEIVMMGHSSGAHSAAVLAASPARWWPDATPVVAGLIGIAGPYDLPLQDPEVLPVFGVNVNPDTVQLPLLVNTMHPPTLLVHGSDDKRVKPFHSERYAVALRAADVAVELQWLDGAGHAGTIASFAAPLHFLNDASGLTLTWLERLPQGAPASGN